MPLSAMQLEKQLFPEALALACQGPDALRALDPSSPLRPMVEGLLALVTFAAHTAASLPPSHGYEPLLRQYGGNAILARLLPHLAVRLGTRMAQESPTFSSVIRAIKYLAKPHRNRSAIVQRIGVLISASLNSSILEQLSYESGLHLDLALLKRAAASDLVALRRVIEIARLLSPRLESKSGPVISPQSAAHELILGSILPKLGLYKKYTWSAIDERHVDAVTEATKQEFGISDFDPRSACRRIDRSKGPWLERKLLK